MEWLDAVARGRPREVERWLREGQDVNEGEALLEAVALGHAAVVAVLLEAGAEPIGRAERTELGLAACAGRVDLLDLLLRSQRFPVDGVDTHGRSALTHAAMCGELPAVTALLAAGADASLRDASDETALLHAAQASRVGMTAALLAAGADAAHALERAQDGYFGGFDEVEATLAAAKAGRHRDAPDPPAPRLLRREQAELLERTGAPGEDRCFSIFYQATRRADVDVVERLYTPEREEMARFQASMRDNPTAIRRVNATLDARLLARRVEERVQWLLVSASATPMTRYLARAVGEWL